LTVASSEVVPGPKRLFGDTLVSLPAASALADLARE
jgi:hypothetical protein